MMTGYTITVIRTMDRVIHIAYPSVLNNQLN